jgi:hypothetical protein
MTLLSTPISPLVLFPIRNWKPEAVAVRFLRNCPEILAEAGENADVGPVERPSRSQEIARRLQAGESPFGTNAENEGEKSRFTMLPAGTTRERLKISGSKRGFEAEVTLEKRVWGEVDSSIYYVVTGVKYKNAGDHWINVPIGWTDNYFLLFK